MKTEVVKISKLKLDPENARKHSERNLEAIKLSLSTYGQQKPLVIDRRGQVVAGNGTLEAARALGWEDIAVVKTRLRGSEATAYAIADNRTAELASWDDGARYVDVARERWEALTGKRARLEKRLPAKRKRRK